MAYFDPLRGISSGVIREADEQAVETIFEVACFIDEAVGVLADILKFNGHCAELELEDITEDEYRHACATFTSLLAMQFIPFDVNAVPAPCDAKEAIRVIAKLAQQVCQGYGLLAAAATLCASFEGKHGKLIAPPFIRVTETGSRFTRCRVELETVLDDVDSFRFMLKMLMTQEQVELFSDAIRFAEIDEHTVIGFTRAIHSLLGWRLADFESRNSAEQEPRQVSPPTFNDAEKKIIDVISKAGNRLTTSEVIARLEATFGPASEGVTKGLLAGLVRNGHLTNRSDKTPRGYGLPRWT